MKSIQRILVAVDLTTDESRLTTGSRLAVEHARSLARALGARAVVFHSTHADESWDADAQSYVERPEASVDGRQRILDHVVGQLREAGIPVELEVSAEPVALGIIRCVLRGDIDLVVSGKRNEPDGTGLRLGSVSAKLLRKCPCAVLVVKPDSDPRPRCILAATDLTPVGERVLEHAVFMSDHCEAELHVVHTFQRPLAIQLEGEESIAQFEEHQRGERRRKLEQQLAEAKCAREAHLHLGIDSPTHAILECARRFEPDLVVLGTVARGGIAGLLLGNTAERLLGRLDCSLLVVKPEDFVCPVSLDS